MYSQTKKGTFYYLFGFQTTLNSGWNPPIVLKQGLQCQTNHYNCHFKDFLQQTKGLGVQKPCFNKLSFSLGHTTLYFIDFEIELMLAIRRHKSSEMAQ